MKLRFSETQKGLTEITGGPPHILSLKQDGQPQMVCRRQRMEYLSSSATSGLCAAWTGSCDRGGPPGQSGFRVLPPPPSPAGVLTLRWSTASMRGAPSHRLGFSCFLCCFVFNFCLESWNVLGKLFLRKFISNPPTVFGAPAYLSPLLLRPPASPCSSPVTTFFPSLQCPGEAGASRPRSVKSKSSGPPVKTASQAANPATPGKKQRESIFLCNGHPRRSLTMGVLLLAVREEPRATSLSSKHLSRGAFFFLLFSSRTKTSPFLGNQSTGLISPNPWHLISIHSSICLQRMPALPHGPYLNFSEAAKGCPVRWVWGGKRGHWTHTSARLHPADRGHCCTQPCQICTWLNRAVYSWCMQLHCN